MTRFLAQPLRFGHHLFALCFVTLAAGALPAFAAGEINFGATRGFAMRMADGLTQARDSIGSVLSALPTMPSQVGRALATIFFPASGTVLPTLALAILVCIALAFVPRMLALLPPLARLRTGSATTPLAAAGRRILFDLTGLITMVIVAIIAVDAAFAHPTLIDHFALAMIDTVLRVRLAMSIPLALLRPGEASLRLVPATDQQVKAAMPVIWATVVLAGAFITCIPVLFEAGIPGLHSAEEAWPAGQALAVVVGAMVSLGGLWATIRFFAAANPAQPLVVSLAYALVALFWLAWTYGVISLDFDFYYAFAGLAILAALTLVIDRFLLLATLEAGNQSDGPAEQRTAYAAALCRCARVAALAIAAVLLSRYVLSQALVMFTSERWALIESGLVNALIYLVGGYVAFELLRVWTKIKFGRRFEAMVPGAGDEEEVGPASRLSTIMPLVQGFVGVTILGVAIIAALSEIGVNITPLLAGAGIFGLAISFGSQSLVRDIVAGLFYMFDDAFRVGEYIEAGRLRGTVERISLRSLRLRHQNGQMHTLPFGQLGSITNHSRDWITVKFNLRFAGDSDIEKVRKLVKRIGQDLLNDEEIGREFLLPLKMQGVTDVVDGALVLRFKFTVKPGKPTIVQREALKRMVLAFRDKDISFAQPAVLVQAENDPPRQIIEGAAGAVIASTIQQRAATQAQAG